jgi:hypothetical protein
MGQFDRRCDAAAPTYSRDAVALTAEQLSSSHNVLPQYEVAIVYTANDGWALDRRL